MAVEQLTLSEAQRAIAELWGTDWATMSAQMSQYGLTPAEMASNDFLRQWSGGAVEPIYAKNGETILGYNFRANQTTVGTGLNSNTAIVRRGYLNHAPATTIETVGQNAGKVKVSRLSGIGTKTVTAASKLAVPLTLASIGITLGKTIDESLYNANPDFWDNIGLSTLNPQTWSNIAGGDGTPGGDFINAIFGIDPNTGETQAYINAETMAYMAYCMETAGVFNLEEYDGVTSYDGSMGELENGWLYPLPLYTNLTPYERIMTGYTPPKTSRAQITNKTDDVISCVVYETSQQGSLTGATKYVPLSVSTRYFTWRYTTESGYSYNSNSKTYIINGTNYYAAYDNSGSIGYVPGCNVGYCDYARYNWDVINRDLIRLIYGGTIEHVEIPEVEGFGNQTGAVIPNFEGLSESDYLSYLQQTYPDMFNNAIDYPVVQPDGSVINYKYVPITLPDTSSTTTTQPISGNQTQMQPSIDPATSTQTLTDLLQKILTQPMTEPITDTPIPPENPTDTGGGSSPVPLVPVGSASALWKIYHPTQAQIDSFGGWLWSSDFIDQILKIFNNPMEAVIGLHKVYATPIDAGTSTIKVGYLDSHVPSAYIEQQYIDVSCGSINLYEQFGNVFDYSPFTDVQLYLPFVGIVPLNVADVMRSTISINYGVDVITGACLAQVEVSRDGNSSVLYQYSGNCAVQYPISSGSYMGIVSSIISVAGGVAATVASGGAAAPLALGAAGGLLNAHTSVQHSGGFSGNAGAMGGKIPYLIITRPQTKVAFNAETMQGYPTNEYITVGECSGYIKADVVHVINVNATDEELSEINDLLLNGIII